MFNRHSKKVQRSKEEKMSLRSSGSEKMNFFNRWHQNYAQVHRRQVESRPSRPARWHFPGRSSQVGPEWTAHWRRPREVQCATTSEAEHVSKKSGDQKCSAKRSETLLEEREKKAIILAPPQSGTAIGGRIRHGKKGERGVLIIQQ